MLCFDDSLVAVQCKFGMWSLNFDDQIQALILSHAKTELCKYRSMKIPTFPSTKGYSLSTGTCAILTTRRCHKQRKDACGFPRYKQSPYIRPHGPGVHTCIIASPSLSAHIRISGRRTRATPGTPCTPRTSPATRGAPSGTAPAGAAESVAPVSAAT